MEPRLASSSPGDRVHQAATRHSKVPFAIDFASALLLAAIGTIALWGLLVPPRVAYQSAQPASQVFCVDDSGGATSAPCANPTAIVHIQDAVNAAAAGDEVRVAAGTYTGSGSSPVVTVDRALTITGGYPGGFGGWTTPGGETLTVIDGQNARDGITYSACCSITFVTQNLSVVNGGIVLASGAAGDTVANNMPVRTGTLSQSVGTISGSAPLTVTGVLTWTGGTQSGLGTTDLLAGGQFNIGGTATADTGRTIDNFGTGTWSGNTTIILNSATFNNQPGGTFTLAGSSQTVSGGPFTFNNSGTMTQTSSGDTNISLCQTFHNNGTFNLQAGRLLFGNGDSSGTFNVAAGAILVPGSCSSQHIFGPASTVTGSGRMESAGTVVVSGTFSLPALVAGGDLTLDSVGSNTVSSIGVITLTGTLEGSRNVTVTQRLDWTGAMQGVGHTDVLTNAVLNITGGPQLHGGRVVNNYANATMAAPGLSMGGATFNNFAALAATGSGHNLNGGVFNNFGTFTKADPGSSTFQPTFNNAGTVNLQSGSSSFAQGDSTGTFNVSAGATLSLCGCGTGAPHTFEQASAITGAGTFEDAGGTAFVSGTLAVPVINIAGGTTQIDGVGANTASSVFTLTIQGGSLGGSRTISVTNALNWSNGSMQGSGHTDLLPGTQFSFTNGTLSSPRVLNNFASAGWVNPMGTNTGMGGGGTFNNEPGASFTLDNPSPFNQDINVNFSNQGTLIKTGTGRTGFGFVNFDNSGLVEVQAGTLVWGGGGTAVQTAGTLRLSGGDLEIDFPFDLQGGVLEGSGTIAGAGPLNNTGGTIRPGLAGPGLITLAGNYSQGPAGTLAIELGGLTPVSQYDRLVVGGSATLDGVMSTSLINGFVPQNGDSFEVVDYGSHTGTFASITGGTFTANYNPTNLTLVVGGGASTPTPSATATLTTVPSSTPTQIASSTRTPAATHTPTTTPSRTASSTATPTTASTATRTPTDTSTAIPTSTLTRTATSLPTNTRTSTATPTVTQTATATTPPTRTQTSASATASATAPDTSTVTRTPTTTPTRTPSATATTLPPSATAPAYTTTPTGTAAPSGTPASTSLPSSTPVATGTPDRVDICHRTASTRNVYVEITVSYSALQAHLRHGDIYPVPSDGCPVGQPRTEPNPFSDIHDGDYFFDRVLNLYDEHDLGGYPDGTFRPYNGATRGQLVKIAVLAFGIPLDPNSSQHFTDVPPSNAFFLYVEAAREAGLAGGYPDGTFRLNSSVTRGQAAKILVQASGYDPVNPERATFTDVPPGSPFYVYAETAYANGMLSGYSDGTFRPNQPTVRGQIAKVTDLATHP